MIGKCGRISSMTTLAQMRHCSTALVRYGDRLPEAERDAWRRFDAQLVGPQLQRLVDQQWASLPAWYVPAGYAEQVWALYGELVVAAVPALATRWVVGWLIEHDQRAARRARVRAGAAAISVGGLVPQPTLAWSVLRVRGVALATEADSWRLAAINNAAELTCAADDRPWEWHDNRDERSWERQDDGFELEVRIGPAQASWEPSADQVAGALAHLATGLDPGRWYVSTI
jgi:hypothetical protein